MYPTCHRKWFKPLGIRELKHARFWALAGDIVLCSWARHFTHTVALSTQVYKWVLANFWGNLTNCGEVTCDGLASHPGDVEILLAPSCYRNQDKLRQLRASSSENLFNIEHFCDKILSEYLTVGQNSKNNLLVGATDREMALISRICKA